MAVSDAAAVLGVQPRQIRSLVAHSQLHAERVGHVWLVSAASVEARRRLNVDVGRPLSAGMVWRLLGRVSGALRDDLGAAEEPTDRRERYRLRQLQVSPPEVSQWSSWLRRRGEHRRVWFHPGTIARVTSDPQLKRADLSTQLGLDVADISPLYMEAAHFGAFVEQHRGQIIHEPDIGAVNAMVVPALADGIDWRGSVAAAALVDFSDHADARVRHAALELLRAVSDVLQRDVGGR